MDRHVPLHCCRKHVAGAGIHAQEVVEKLIEDERLSKHLKDLLTVTKALKTIPVVIEEQVALLDGGKLKEEEFFQNMYSILHQIRTMRRTVMQAIVDVRNLGAPFTIFQKDTIQEMAELWGELWQMEKHLIEYLADIRLKLRGGKGEEGKSSR